MSLNSGFIGTSIEIWENGRYKTVEIASLSNEDLLDEYGAEEESSSRSTSTDPPSPLYKLKEEILRRMGVEIR